MKNVLIMSVCGPDLHGKVNNLIATANGGGGNVLGKKVMRFSGQLAAIMRIEVGDAESQSFKELMQKGNPGLLFSFTEEAENTTPGNGRKSIELQVNCRNRPGVQEELQAIMDRLEYQVEQSEFTRCRVANIGETLISGRFALKVPGDISSEEVADEIEALTEDARVEVV